MTKLSILGINDSNITINNCENFIVSLPIKLDMCEFDIVDILPSEIKLKLYDDRDETYSRIISSQMQKQMNEFFQIGDPSSYKFSLEFDLDQTLLIYDGCFLTNVMYSDMDLIDGHLLIDMTISYDTCAISSKLPISITTNDSISLEDEGQGFTIDSYWDDEIYWDDEVREDLVQVSLENSDFEDVESDEERIERLLSIPSEDFWGI